MGTSFSGKLLVTYNRKGSTLGRSSTGSISGAVDKDQFIGGGSCTDLDLDGYGVCPNCGIANGCTQDGNDCDDSLTGGGINPGAAEICFDNINEPGGGNDC